MPFQLAFLLELWLNEMVEFGMFETVGSLRAVSNSLPGGVGRDKSRDTMMEWQQQAKRLFSVPKPAHFTDYWHCWECAEHDATLLAADVDSIGLPQLGHPGWDPLCFSSAEGILYTCPP